MKNDGLHWPYKKFCPEVGGNVRPLGRKKEGDARGVTRDLSIDSIA
jgi:hypothetical protein